MAMYPSVIYTPCDTSLRDKTGNIIMFALFEEGNSPSETCNDAKSGEKSDDDLIMPPLLSE